MQTDPAPLAPLLGVRSDGESGASSASDLLVTAFGELMRPGGGAAWTQTLITTLDLVAIEEKASRQAISRLAGRGWLTAERIGRRTRWHLTPWATGLLERGADRIYGLGQHQDDWSGTWLVLLASVPESQRSVRGPLAVRLGWAGFGSLGQGVWICPRVERETEAAQVLSQLHIEGAVMFRSEMTDTGDPVELARRAWRPDELTAAYDAFLSTADRIEADGDQTTVAGLIRLVDAWRHFPLLDPDLPTQLHTADWPGSRAARRFTELRASWAPVARRWWSETDRSFG